ncbi:MAG: dTDP-glucose 4,6-dehydratase [Coxiellaceae bacterium]|nr:MAG: dTDP-glucose 4,6-dehydratase [Coxiellaceae bacterium]
MRKLLVTGGAGFIGANFVHYWLQHQPQDRLVVLDALTYAGNLANLAAVKTAPQLRFVHGSINDYALVTELLQQEQIDTLVHFAAESHVDRSITHPDEFINTNIVGTHQLLKAARQVWLLEGKGTPHCRFHHVSTDEVYGSLSPTDPAFTETTPYAPNSPYSASKAASDHLVRAYHHTYGLPVTTSNCSNNYGPYQFPEKLIPLLITHALHGKALPIYGDGQNIRDWLYVEDHCRGIELILTQGKLGEVYNIGGNNEQTNITIAQLVCQLIDEKFAKESDLAKRYPHCPAAQGKPTRNLIQFVKDRPGHDRRYAINADKAINELGYQPQENFLSGFTKTVNWYLEHEAWWRPLLKPALTTS